MLADNPNLEHAFDELVVFKHLPKYGCLVRIKPLVVAFVFIALVRAVQPGIGILNVGHFRSGCVARRVESGPAESNTASRLANA
jgi:hypothetical protein